MSTVLSMSTMPTMSTASTVSEICKKKISKLSKKNYTISSHIFIVRLLHISLDGIKWWLWWSGNGRGRDAGDGTLSDRSIWGARQAAPAPQPRWNAREKNLGNIFRASNDELHLPRLNQTRVTIETISWISTRFQLCLGGGDHWPQWLPTAQMKGSE